MININSNAPVFTALNQDEQPITLANLRGQWLVLYFYPKDDTPGCTKEACGFSEILQNFQKLNAKVIGVSPDLPEKHRKFHDKYQLKIELLSDPEKTLLKAYEAWGLKKNYGKEYEGVIRSTFIIDPHGIIREKWHNVRVDGHVEKVFTRLQELLNA